MNDDLYYYFIEKDLNVLRSPSIAETGNGLLIAALILALLTT